MIRNKFLRLFFIPFPGIIIPFFNKQKKGSIMILPFALQVLVKDPIKHHEFTDADLKIRIDLNEEYPGKEQYKTIA